MAKNKFKPGDLVINTGRLLGQGYVWRVEAAYPRNPYDKTDHRPMVDCRNIGPLHGKPERGDYHLGGVFCYLETEKQLFDGKNKPAHQLALI